MGVGEEMTGRQREGERDRRTREGRTDRWTQQEETHLGEQVVQVAEAAAFFTDWDEVASPSTAQWGPGEHHLWGGGPEGRCEVHPVHRA